MQYCSFFLEQLRFWLSPLHFASLLPCFGLFYASLAYFVLLVCDLIFMLNILSCCNSSANQEAFCVVCETPGSISDQLFCTSCGQHYHGNCLDPAVEVNPVVRAGWQCPECKICQTCRFDVFLC